MGNVLYLEEPPADYIGNPQTEDGFTSIANELLEAIIRFDFTKRELKVVLFVIRKTYGYNKKSDWIALSQFSIGTGLHAPHISATVSDLVSKKVLLKRSYESIYVIGLNKKYNEWTNDQIGNLPKQSLPKQSLGVTKTVTTKDKLTKDIYIPDDFHITESVRKWAEKNGHTNLEAHLEWFVDWAKSKNKKYVNWDATFRNAIRGNWAKLKTSTSRPIGGNSI